MTYELTVWAPEATHVDVLLDRGRRVPMDQAGDGCWRACLDGVGHGTRYAFSLDGGPARPDPRSASQPDGIGAWSEIVDHERFAWTDHGWRGCPLPGAIVYELHVGTFSPAGTFDGVIEHLDHLVDLAVDLVELMPVAEFSGQRGWGYDGVNLFAPHHAYGGPDGLKRLVDACHARGLGVLLDVVYNHLGPAGNHLAEFGPYFSDRHHTAWGEGVNLDGPASGPVRRFFLDNAAGWLRDYHLDGLRLDAVHALVDESATHFLEELSGEVDALAAQLGRTLVLVAESDRNDPREVRSRDAGGYGMEAVWADDWHHALHTVLTGERGGYYADYGSFEQLGKALRQGWVLDGTWSGHRRRHHGRRPVGLRGHQLVVATQTHDQVGNRAAGERLAGLVGPGRLRVAAALLLTSPFTPMLFQGEEWGASTPFQYFTDHQDPELGAAVRDGRQREFAHFAWETHTVPDPQAASTFERSCLRWDEVAEPDHRELLSWYRELVALRRALPALADPRLDRVSVETDAATGTVVVQRGDIAIVVNLGPAEYAMEAGPDLEVLAASDVGIAVVGERLVLPVDSVAIVRSVVSRTGA